MQLAFVDFFWSALTYSINSASAGLDSILAGWGRSNETPIRRPRKLKELRVKVYDVQVCARSWQMNVSSLATLVCAGVPGRRFQSACSVILPK